LTRGETVYILASSTKQQRKKNNDGSRNSVFLDSWDYVHFKLGHDLLLSLANEGKRLISVLYNIP
tara:strand:+ start:217 stop:411 length:195 start_codon:yes stop_codon:yes gene_type:complete